MCVCEVVTEILSDAQTFADAKSNLVKLVKPLLAPSLVMQIHEAARDGLSHLEVLLNAQARARCVDETESLRVACVALRKSVVGVGVLGAVVTVKRYADKLTDFAQAALDSQQSFQGKWNEFTQLCEELGELSIHNPVAIDDQSGMETPKAEGQAVPLCDVEQIEQKRILMRDTKIEKEQDFMTRQLQAQRKLADAFKFEDEDRKFISEHMPEQWASAIHALQAYGVVMTSHWVSVWARLFGMPASCQGEAPERLEPTDWLSCEFVLFYKDARSSVRS